jgi:cytoskeletal protein RodZ
VFLDRPPNKLTEKKGKVMERKVVRISGFVGLMLVIISLMVIGCSREQAPAPPAAPAPTAAPAPSVAPPAGTAQPAPTATPAQNSNQIQAGMTSAQVQQIMGAPAQTEIKGAITEWKYLTPQGKVEVKLQNDKVTIVERH